MLPILHLALALPLMAPAPAVKATVGFPANAGQYVHFQPNSGATSSCPGSDNFAGSGGLNLTCWTTPIAAWSAAIGGTAGSLGRSSGFLVNSSGGFSTGVAAYTGGTTMGTGGVEFTVNAFSSGNFYVCALASATAVTGYCYNAANADIVAWNSGSATPFVFACTAVIVGDTYKLEVTLSTHTIALYNVTAGGGPLCSGNDSTITSGVPLFMIDYSSGGSGTQLANFAETP